MLIVAPLLASAVLLRLPVCDAAVWVRSGPLCMPAATRAVPHGYLAESGRGAQHLVPPRALPDARTLHPPYTLHKVIRT